MSSEKEIVKLYKIRKTVLQMLTDRNYAISQKDVSMGLKSFKKKYTVMDNIDRNNLTILCNKKEELLSQQLFVFFCDKLKAGVDTCNTYIKKMEEEKTYRAIIILQKTISPYAKKALQTLVDPYKIELFFENELLVNITEHELVPKHSMLTKDEKYALLRKYSLKQTQLPRIKEMDPIARYYGLSRGQVIKIIRASETAGRYVTYRLVV